MIVNVTIYVNVVGLCYYLTDLHDLDHLHHYLTAQYTSHLDLIGSINTKVVINRDSPIVASSAKTAH